MNEAHGLERFLIARLGIMVYPKYQVCKGRSVFKDAASLGHYEKAIEQISQIDRLVNLEQTEAALATLRSLLQEHSLWPASEDEEAMQMEVQGFDFEVLKSTLESEPLPSVEFPMRFTAEWMHMQAATVAVSLLEQQKEYYTAICVLLALLQHRPVICPKRHGQWWLRLCINLEHVKLKVSSLHAARAGRYLLLATAHALALTCPLLTLPTCV